MRHLFDVFGHRELDDWRDRQILLAAKILHQTAADLIGEADPLLKTATWRQGFLSPQSFIAENVTPRLRAASEPIVEMIVANANDSLAELVRYHAVWTRRPGAPLPGNAAFEGAGDLALAAGPIAAGTAIATALPALAMTTTGGLLGTGLFATTVVAWPVVAVGGAAVAVALATGALNASRIWGEAESRLRRRVAEHIGATLIRGTKDHPAVLEQLVALFTEAAREARTRR